MAWKMRSLSWEISSIFLFFYSELKESRVRQFRKETIYLKELRAGPITTSPKATAGKPG